MWSSYEKKPSILIRNPMSITVQNTGSLVENKDNQINAFSSSLNQYFNYLLGNSFETEKNLIDNSQFKMFSNRVYNINFL